MIGNRPTAAIMMSLVSSFRTLRLKSPFGNKISEPIDESCLDNVPCERTLAFNPSRRKQSPTVMRPSYGSPSACAMSHVKTLPRETMSASTMPA